MATTEMSAGAARELDELYRAHAAEVYRYAYAVLGNSSDAEDVTQTTFVNAMRALERGEQPRKPTNWLITIAHNLIRNRFRQSQTRPREVELDRDVPAFEAADDGPSVDDLVRALQRIPPSQREALVLREMEGRPYKEICAILEVSQTALETLIFRARRSLAEELENLVTCDRAELALSKQTDERLGRKERKRLVAHLEECTSCARVAVSEMKRRRTFKVLAALPLPFSLTLFKGAPAASAAVAGTAAGVGAGGVTAKLAIGLAAVAVAGGAGYEGVQAVREPAAPVRPAKPTPAAAVPVVAPPASFVRADPRSAKPLANKSAKPLAKKPDRVKTQRPKATERGRSATAPGRAKPPKTSATPVRGRSATAPGRIRPPAPPKPKKP
ncbi:MAG: sigma-70 family RNA polymerase sigma factor [Actinomycetota bacterium]|nr:sigma-70 family RNA polymerase sigma factor [Actinomycetota bacterium]